MSATTMAGSQESEETDRSVLQKPISLGKSDVMQIWQSLTTGTDEVRNMLVNECKIIMECKVCGSLFRGLPNFLAHKRVYCKDPHGRDPLLLGNINLQMDTVFLEPTDPEEDKKAGKPAAFYGDVQARIDENSLLKSEARVKLQRIDGNKNARRQEIIKSGSVTVNPNVVVLEPKTADGPVSVDIRRRKAQPVKFETGGQAATKSAKPKSAAESNLTTPTRNSKHLHEMYKQMLSRFRFCDVKNLTCNKCEISYQSFKSLKRHMVKKHVDSLKKSGVPCPKCGTYYEKIWNVTRHLMQVHKMSRREIETYRTKYADRFKPVSSMLVSSSPGSDEKKDNKKSQVKEPVEMKRGLFAPTTPNKSEVLSKQGNNTCVMSVVAATPPEQTSTSGNIQFKRGFSLLKCSCCNKVFGKKEAYTRHVDICDSEIIFNDVSLNKSDDSSTDSVDNQSDSENTKPQSTKQGDHVIKEKVKVQGNSGDDDDNKNVVTKPDGQNKDAAAPSQNGSMAKFEEHLYKLRFTNHQKLSDERLFELSKIIDETKSKCLQCGKRFDNNSGLHRHAVRHMGWKRFKCKMCAYTAFNRSDVNTHLRRVHPTKTKGAKDCNKFMVNLEEETSKIKVNRSKQETKTATDVVPKEPAAVKLGNGKDSVTPLKREVHMSRDRSRSSSSNATRTSQRTSGPSLGNATGTSPRTTDSSLGNATRTSQRTSGPSLGNATGTPQHTTDSSPGNATRTSQRTSGPSLGNATRTSQRTSGPSLGNATGTPQHTTDSSPGNATGTSPRTTDSSPGNASYNISTRRVSRTFDLRPCRSSSLPPPGNDVDRIRTTGKRSLPVDEADCMNPAKVICLD